MRALLLALALLLTTPVMAKSHVVSEGEYCVAINVYYEARWEPEQGMQGVAYVTLNRAKARRQSLCHVVFAYKQFSWVEQFKVLDGEGHIKPEFRPQANDARWKLCKEIAREALAHPDHDFTEGSQYFVARYIFPQCLKRACSWVKNLEYVDRYGAHLFFKERVAKKPPVYVQPFFFYLSFENVVKHQLYSWYHVSIVQQFNRKLREV
jgi:spore germination cell wall hydrolase CwlJ-like protein